MDVNQMEKLFKEYVDCNLYLYQEPDLLSINKRHELNLEQENLYNEFIKKKLSNKLKLIFEDNQTFSKINIHRIKRQIILRHIIENEKIKPYLEVIETLNAYLSSDIQINSLDNATEWKEIIKTVIDLSIVDNHNWSKELHFYTKEYIEASSAKELLNKGYSISVNNGDIFIDENEYQKIANDIEYLLKSVGGYNVAEYIFNVLSSKFNSNLQRYEIVRKNQRFPNKKTRPQLPYNYLLNLCVKHFKKYSHQQKIYNKDLSNLFNMATCFISVIGIQEYNQYSNIFIGKEDFIDYVHKNILFDYIIGIKQYNPLFIPSIIEGMLKPFFEIDNVKKRFKISIGQMTQFVDYLLNKRAQDQSFNLINTDEILHNIPNISKNQIRYLLKFFSHNRSINSTFNTPTSLSNFSKKPLMQIKKESFILIDRTWCSISFYDAICDALRPMVLNFDEKLGYQLENFIKSLLNKKGFVFSSGFYSDNKECDLIIESKKRIILIEIKKKPLTRIASIGSGVHLYRDITKGLLNSQIQLGKHHLFLLKHGKLILRKFRQEKQNNNNKHSEQVVELKGRTVERVSLNAWDYGFLNDRLATQNILQYLTYLEVHATDPFEDKELIELRKNREILLKQFEELQTLTNNNDLRKTYFDCSFISLQQFMLLIQDSQSKEDFVCRMFQNKSVHMGTGDVYIEYDYYRKLLNKR